MPIKLKANNGNIDLKAPIKQLGGGAVDSVNGMTGDVVLEIPSKTSQLENDSDFATSAAISNAEERMNYKLGSYALKTEIEGLATKSEVEAVEDKIPTNSVQYTTQTLTDAQKAQARENIGAQEKICEVEEGESLGNNYQAWATATNGGRKPIAAVKVAGTLYLNVSGNTSGMYVSYTVGGYEITVSHMYSTVSISPSAEFAFYSPIYHQIPKEFIPPEFFVVNVTEVANPLGLSRTKAEIESAIAAEKVPIILYMGKVYHLADTGNVLVFTTLVGETIIIKSDSKGYESFPLLIHQTHDPETAELLGVNQFNMRTNPATDMQIATKKYVDDGLAGKAVAGDYVTTTQVQSMINTAIAGITDGDEVSY